MISTIRPWQAILTLCAITTAFSLLSASQNVTPSLVAPGQNAVIPLSWQSDQAILHALSRGAVFGPAIVDLESPNTTSTIWQYNDSGISEAGITIQNLGDAAIDVIIGGAGTVACIAKGHSWSTRISGLGDSNDVQLSTSAGHARAAWVIRTLELPCPPEGGCP